jgi:hypothetical protein
MGSWLHPINQFHGAAEINAGLDRYDCEGVDIESRGKNAARQSGSDGSSLPPARAHPAKI